MQPPGIGRKRTYRGRGRGRVTVATITTTVRPVVADVIPPAVLRGTPGPGRILPLGLGRQAVIGSFLAVQPTD